MPWKYAIVEVLHEEGGALHYDTIVERVLDAQLRSSFDAMPGRERRRRVAAIVRR